MEKTVLSAKRLSQFTEVMHFFFILSSNSVIMLCAFGKTDIAPLLMLLWFGHVSVYYSYYSEAVLSASIILSVTEGIINLSI